MQTNSNVGRTVFIKFLFKDAGILINILAQLDCTHSPRKTETEIPRQLLRNIEIIWLGWGVKYFQVVEIFCDCYNYNFIASLIVIYESANEKQEPMLLHAQF